MPLVTATPRGDSDGSIVRQFVDSIDTNVKTYTYSTTQDNLIVWNKGYVPIILNVGTYSNVTIQPLTIWEMDVSFSSLTTNTVGGISEIQITAREYDDIPVLRSQFTPLTDKLTVSPSSNIYTLDLQNKTINNFEFTSSDATAKSIAFTNISSTVGIIQVTAHFICTTACAITYPASVSFGTAPTFTTGKKYNLAFISYDGGTSFEGFCVQGGA